MGMLFQAFNAPTVAPETGIVVPSIEAEIEREVWNAPRPDSTNIVLDSTRTEQVCQDNCFSEFFIREQLSFN